MVDLDAGDRVIARHNLGGFIRARVPRGLRGVVTARSTDGALTVRFHNGQELVVDPDDVDAPTAYDDL